MAKKMLRKREEADRAMLTMLRGKVQERSLSAVKFRRLIDPERSGVVEFRSLKQGLKSLGIPLEKRNFRALLRACGVGGNQPLSVDEVERQLYLHNKKADADPPPEQEGEEQSQPPEVRQCGGTLWRETCGGRVGRQVASLMRPNARKAQRGGGVRGVVLLGSRTSPRNVHKAPPQSLPQPTRPATPLPHPRRQEGSSSSDDDDVVSPMSKLRRAANRAAVVKFVINSAPDVRLVLADHEEAPDYSLQARRQWTHTHGRGTRMDATHQWTHAWHSSR